MVHNIIGVAVGMGIVMILKRVKKTGVIAAEEGVNLLHHDKKLQILDITITIVLFIIGCVAGKLMMVYASDSWLSFNGPAIGVLIVGEPVWWRIRNKLIKKWEED